MPFKQSHVGRRTPAWLERSRHPTLTPQLMELPSLPISGWSTASCWDVRRHHWAELTVEWNRTGALPEQFWEQANLRTDTENEQSLALIYYSALMWNRVFKAHSNAESQKDLIRWHHSWQAATWLLLTTGSSIILFLSEFYFYDKTRKQRMEMVPFKF